MIWLGKKKIKIKNIFQGILLFVFLAGTLYFVSYLNQTDTEQEEKMTWKAEALDEVSQEELLAAENKTFQLYFKPVSGEIRIEDKRSGQSWRSNPKDAAEDKVAFGLNKTNILSQLFVEYVDPQSNSYIVNSYLGSIKNATFNYQITKEGVYITYYFNEAGFEIPVYYGITEEYFTAKVLCEQIKQHGKFKISAISLLPYMGCGTKSDSGYLVFPDGSGSLMEFNNKKQSYLAYSQPVYGSDAAINTLSNLEVKENITMPIYGIKRNDYAMLSIIAKGEYQAEIKGEVSGKTTSNNIAYSTLRLIKVETNTLLSGSANEEKSEMLSEQFLDLEEYEVRYYFLEKDSGYTEMGLCYQQYLVKEKGMKPLKNEEEIKGEKEKAKINITYIGGIQQQETMLGVPYTTVKSLTSYKEAGNLSKELKELAPIDLMVSYAGFLKEGYHKNKLPSKISYESKLGGKKAFQSLLLTLQKENIEFYPSFDLSSMYQSGNGYSSTDSARYVNRSAAYQYSYLLTTGERNKTTEPFTLLSPTKLSGLSEKFAKAVKKEKITSYGLEGITDTVYSDFRKNGVSRNAAGKIIETTLAFLKEQTNDLLMNHANAYAFPYADKIINVPTSSSEYDMADRSIPLYQIVMSGYSELYSSPVNMEGNIEEFLLNLAETGVHPSFLLMAEDGMAVMNTEYSYFYANCYEDWKLEIKKAAEQFLALASVDGQRIIKHIKEDGLAVTTYENGSKVYTNYNKEAVMADGLSIPAKSFLLKEGE